MYELFGKKISGPFTIPSGIVATETATIERIAAEVPEVGILTTKSIGPEPKAGNREPIIAKYSPVPFSFINAVGLTNPGADEFARKLGKIKISDDKFLLCSIFGSSEEEFKQVAGKLLDYADGFELNVSCPHSDKYGRVIGQDLSLVERVTKAVASLGKPVFVKISPTLDVNEMTKYAVAGGASGITAINTKGPEPFLFDSHPVLTNKVGGIAGRAVLELGLKSISQVRALTSLPIIACGGISTAEHMKKYRAAGASFFGVGCALAGMGTGEIKEYFHELLNDYEKGTNKAEGLLKDKLNMEYRKFHVKENKRLAEDLFTLRLDDSIKAEPGQFVFTWLPEKGEKPFSIMDDEPLTLLIQKRGCFTEELSKLKEGDTLYVRGPHGNSPKADGKLLLVGGGTGVAALYLFAKRNKNSVAVLGARDKSRLSCVEEYKSACSEVHLATATGEVGRKGYVTDLLDDVIRGSKPEYCLNCGPEAMVNAVVQKESKYLAPERIFSSVELMTKCGVGLCGSCATRKGVRNCVDGTFFRPEQL